MVPHPTLPRQSDCRKTRGPIPNTNPTGVESTIGAGPPQPEHFTRGRPRKNFQPLRASIYLRCRILEARGSEIRATVIEACSGILAFGTHPIISCKFDCGFILRPRLTIRRLEESVFGGGRRGPGLGSSGVCLIARLSRVESVSGFLNSDSRSPTVWLLDAR